MVPEIRYCEVSLTETRDGDGPGTLNGILMPYGRRAGNLAEVFEPGSLHWPDHGVVLREQHNRQAPIIRFVPEDRDDGLYVAIPLPDTQRGRDAAVNVRNGTLRGLSVEFLAQKQARRDGLRRIQRAALVGAGLVDDPAYTEATVQVRHRIDGRRRLWL